MIMENDCDFIFRLLICKNQSDIHSAYVFYMWAFTSIRHFVLVNRISIKEIFDLTSYFTINWQSFRNLKIC